MTTFVYVAAYFVVGFMVAVCTLRVVRHFYGRLKGIDFLAAYLALFIWPVFVPVALIIMLAFKIARALP